MNLFINYSPFVEIIPRNATDTFSALYHTRENIFLNKKSKRALQSKN